MSSTRLQFLKDSGQYSEKIISQFEKVISENDKLPKIFYVEDIGKNTISNILEYLNIQKFDVLAPNGSSSPVRKIVLH